MPLIELNTITLLKESSQIGLLVASVVTSKSGVEEATLITNTNQLDTYFDDDFPYKYMYYKLLENNVVLLLQQPLNDTLKENKATLRLSSKVGVEYCYPKYGRTYSPVEVSEVNAERVDKRIDTFNIYFNFDNPDFNTSSYIILSNNGRRDVIWFKSGGSNVPIESTYYNRSFSVDLNTFNTDDLVLSEIKRILTDNFGYEVVNLSGQNFKITKYTQEEILYFYNLSGLTFSYDKREDQDKLSEITESSKLVEFTSKFIGSKSESLKLTISKVESSLSKVYDLVLEYGNNLESYRVSTEQIFNYEEEFIFLEDVINNESKLITCSVFQVGCDLPEGEFYLGGTEDYELSLNDYVNAVNKLIESDYYPDFIVNDNSVVGFNLTFINNLLYFCEKKDCQSFIHVPISAIQEPFFRPVNEKDNRLIYVAGEGTIENNPIPNYYYYLMNFLYNNYLEIVKDYVITFTEFTQSQLNVLKKYFINYLTYDNLKYYYVSLMEDSTYIGVVERFTASKINRTFKDNEYLLGTNLNNILNTVASLVNYLKDLLPIISTLTYDVKQVENTLYITLDTKLKSLVKKNIKVNITLKYK